MKKEILSLIDKRIKDNAKLLEIAKSKNDSYDIAYLQGKSIEALEIWNTIAQLEDEEE